MCVVSKKCQTHYQGSVVERCQDEAKWKKERKEKTAGVPRETDAVEGGVTCKAVFVAQSTRAGGDPSSKSELGVGQKDWLEGPASGLKQKWDWSQATDAFEEGDVMDWLEDAEMVRQWEDVGKGDEKITVRNMEGGIC